MFEVEIVKDPYTRDANGRIVSSVAERFRVRDLNEARQEILRRVPEATTGFDAGLLREGARQTILLDGVMIGAVWDVVE